MREYWIVVPYEQFLQQFVLDDNNRYRLHGIYTAEDVITSFIFSDLQIHLQAVFG